MPKEFYTEKDIEDMVKRGVLSLDVTDDVVLTELAYEKAGRLGMRLNRHGADNPPTAPIRPYLSEKEAVRPAAPPVAASLPFGGPAGVAPAAQSDLSARIRSAVIAKLGNQVDPALLDVIIQRVLKTTGVK
jgi:hypothetical protein